MPGGRGLIGDPGGVSLNIAPEGCASILWRTSEKAPEAAQAMKVTAQHLKRDNVIDRIVYGAVADFLNMSCCGIENPYAFNVADISIFAGAFGLILFTGGKDTPKSGGKAVGGKGKGKTS